MDWQPIETAPIDGTEIDLWARNATTGEYCRVPDCAWSLMRDWTGREYEGWRGLYRGLHREYIAPTHWMPLPPPPQGA